MTHMHSARVHAARVRATITSECHTQAAGVDTARVRATRTPECHTDRTVRTHARGLHTKPERMQQAPRECLCSPTGCQGSVQGAHLARDPRPAPTRLAALAHRSLLFRSRTPYAAAPWMVCYDAVSKALKDLVQDSKHSRHGVIAHL